MEKEKLEILIIIKNIIKINIDRIIEIPSIDRRMILKYPEIIYNNELQNLLLELVNEEYLEWVNENNLSVRITQKGLNFVNK